MEAGLTYFDTAYVYDSGDSERVAKEALVDRYFREKYGKYIIAIDLSKEVPLLTPHSSTGNPAGS